MPFSSAAVLLVYSSLANQNHNKSSIVTLPRRAYIYCLHTAYCIRIADAGLPNVTDCIHLKTYECGLCKPGIWVPVHGAYGGRRSACTGTVSISSIETYVKINTTIAPLLS